MLTGPTGHPPKWYEVPVPDAAGGPPTVFTYRRAPAGYTKRLGIQRGWKYEYVSEGRTRRTLKWPWSSPTGGERTGGHPWRRRRDLTGTL